jgi:hypothetical protein
VDVERAELEVLQGVGLAAWPRIQQVVAEVRLWLYVLQRQGMPADYLTMQHCRGSDVQQCLVDQRWMRARAERAFVCMMYADQMMVRTLQHKTDSLHRHACCGCVCRCTPKTDGWQPCSSCCSKQASPSRLSRRTHT